jgi:hypothetical protein
MSQELCEKIPDRYNDILKKVSDWRDFWAESKNDRPLRKTAHGNMMVLKDELRSAIKEVSETNDQVRTEKIYSRVHKIQRIIGTEFRTIYQKSFGDWKWVHEWGHNMNFAYKIGSGPLGDYVFSIQIKTVPGAYHVEYINFEGVSTEPSTFEQGVSMGTRFEFDITDVGVDFPTIITSGHLPGREPEGSVTGALHGKSLTKDQFNDLFPKLDSLLADLKADVKK